MSRDHRPPDLLFVFLVGAATGAVFALLCAPSAGAETRARLARALRRTPDPGEAFVAAADSLQEPH